MNILYIGDIMGKPGIDTVAQALPKLKQEKQFDLVIAQAENVTNGKSMSLADMKILTKLGVDFFTGGNHTPKLKEITPLLEDNNKPVIGPANMHGCPGRGWKYINTSAGQVLIISLLGETFGNYKPEIDNPLQTIDKILAENTGVNRAATIVDFHGDYSSEKRVIGYYLDGKVTALIGDHWHVPTADATVLPKGTAHITDVGMCGTLNSSLGVSLDVIIPRWRDGKQTVNQLASEKPWQFNAVLIDSNANGLANSITPINIKIA